MKQSGWMRVYAAGIECLHRLGMSLGFVLFLLLVLPSNPARAEEAASPSAGQDSEQFDMYYDAMLRSIELDKSRWKSFSRST